MICSYCGKSCKPTKEHIIPNGFLNKMNRKEMISESDAVPNRLVYNDLVIKDVCSTCNNGPLSELDGYALSLILNYNDVRKKLKSKIDFSYDLQLLQRWLLKVAFNSARSTKARHDCLMYQKNIKYILGETKPVSYIQTYIKYLDTSGIYEPKYEIDEFRIGKIRLKYTITDSIAYRYIIINSFAFVTIVADPDDKAINAVENEIKKMKFKKLNSNGHMHLNSDSSFYVESILGTLNVKKKFLQKRDLDDSLHLIVINRKMVEEQNIDVFESVISEYCSDKDKLSAFYQRFYIMIEGYDEETREVYQIKEFQDYCRIVLKKYPELFWLVDLSMDNTFKCELEAMYYAYINDSYITDTNDCSRIFKVNNGRVLEILSTVYGSIDSITNNFGFDKSIKDETKQKVASIMLNDKNLKYN